MPKSKVGVPHTTPGKGYEFIPIGVYPKKGDEVQSYPTYKWTPLSFDLLHPVSTNTALCPYGRYRRKLK